MRCDHDSEKCDCPFAWTKAAADMDNSGCLPSMSEIMRLRVEHGKMWACHNDETKPCVGNIRALKDAGLPYKYEGSHTLITDREFSLYPLAV